MKSTSELDFKKIFNDLYDPMMIRDKNERIVYMNKSALELFGYAYDEINGKNAIDLLVPPPLKEGYKRLYDLLIANKDFTGRIQEKNLLRKDGFELVLESSTSLIFIEEDPFVITFYRDITDRKQTEEKFKEFQEMFFSITNNARDAIIMINQDGLITYWNPAAEKILGYSSLEVIDQDVHQLLAPLKYHAAYKANFPAFIKTGEGPAIDKTIELAAIRKDGVEIPVELSVSSVKISKHWNAIGILRDISERKENEQNIKNLVSIYKRVLETLDYDFVILDPISYEVTIINGYIDLLQKHSETKRTCHEMLFNNEEPCKWCKIKDLREGQILKHTVYFPEDKCNCDFLFLSFTANNKPLILCRMNKSSNI